MNTFQIALNNVWVTACEDNALLRYGESVLGVNASDRFLRLPVSPVDLGIRVATRHGRKKD